MFFLHILQSPEEELLLLMLDPFLSVSLDVAEPCTLIAVHIVIHDLVI